MSARLDLYIEKILDKMNLDDAQRADVEIEMRGHLEEAIDQAVRAGMNRDQAEDEAMLRFGQPSIIARQFGITSGTAWLVFEQVCVGAILYWLVLWQCRKFIHKFPETVDYYWVIHVIAAVVFVAYVTAKLWNRVEVNGTFRVYRFLRRTASIPFNQINDVRLEKGHLFGKRRIHLEYDGGYLFLSQKMRNARTAALAIETLAPEAVRPEVSAVFRNWLTKIRRETATFRWGLSLLWLIALAGFLPTIEPLWRMQGITVWSLIAIVSGGIAVGIQACYHADRARRGLANLLALSLVIYLPSFATFCGFGDLGHYRWVAAAFPLIVILGLLILWWRGPKLILVGLVLASIIAAYVLQYVFVAQFSHPTKGIAYVEQLPGNLWAGGMGGEEMVISMGGDFESDSDITRVVVVDGEDEYSSILPTGMWDFLGRTETSAPLYLKREPSACCNRETTTAEELYSINAKGDLKFEYALPGGCSWGSFPGVVSPDGRHLAVSYSPEADSDDRMLAIVNMKTNDVRRFDQFDLMDVSKWTVDSKLRVIDRETTGQEGIETTAPARYRQWMLDPKTGKAKFQRQIQFNEGEHHIFIPFSSDYEDFLMPSGDYALLQGSSERELAIGNMETGAVTKLPPARTELISSDWPTARTTANVDWDDRAGRVAYISLRGELIAADFNGVYAKWQIDEEFQIDALQISPDGQNVLAGLRERPNLLMNGCAQLWLYRTNGTSQRVDSLNTFASIYSKLFEWNEVRWLPDSSAAFYQVIHVWWMEQGTIIRKVDIAALDEE